MSAVEPTVTFLLKNTFCFLLEQSPIPGFFYGNDYAFWGQAAEKIQAFFGFDVMAKVMALKDWFFAYDPVNYKYLVDWANNACDDWFVVDSDQLTTTCCLNLDHEQGNDQMSEFQFHLFQIGQMFRIT
ncbi:hypothetical protein CAPTEDRAFT_201089 [Capitella teleta]|uniref:Uncharacterized protein n=1 Tax=Capitella teleta TaxID=283909 RepID=R7UKH7_CAPTE|nr:hypothetical protein CAPTEDRAFT_201089 [Capitella teleta]|eukprot:ELU04308.1 hypothetical protein CAPTEDRAFT_201089 [Capitella teleta]